MRPDRRTLLRRLGGLGVAALGGAVAGCSTGSGASAGGDDDARVVSMPGDLTFDPQTATVRPGTTVRWINESEVDHTVTAYGDRIPADAAYFASGGFESESQARTRMTGGLIRPGETYEHTFGVPGTYEYFCIPHESSMRGTVRVRR